MVPHLNMSGKLDTMEVSRTVVEDDNSGKLRDEKMMICASNCEDNSFGDAAIKASEEKLMMTSANNCQDNSFHMEVSTSCHNSIVPSKGHNENLEVDIIDNVNPVDERVSGEELQDVTESSSSFGCTDSGDESTAMSSDVEVESRVQDDKTSSLGFGGFSDLFRTRKKKLTPEWRNFVRPLMWRCKWVELQIRELNSQARKYDRKLAECEKRKQHQIENSEAEELGIKSAPFDCQNRSVKLMKRKKRRRVEETDDLASYTSCHNFFSYYVKGRPIADTYMDDDSGNTDVVPAEKNAFGIAEWTPFEFKDSDAFENILRKVEEAQLQVRQLRARMDKVVKENAGNFASNNSSFAPRNSVFPHMNLEKMSFGTMYTVPQQTPENKLAMPEGSASCYGDVTPLPDDVERTDQPQIGGRCDEIPNEIPASNRPVKEELNNVEEIGNQRIAESEFGNEGKARHVQCVSDPSSAGKRPVSRAQPAVKIRSISKMITPNKRKRGRRKARSGRWSRRSSG